MSPNLLEAREMFSKMTARKSLLADDSVITQVNVIQEGNMTIAIINNEYIGWSKFNPQDIACHPVRDREGCIVDFREESKFSEHAGKQKALHRALRKIINTNKTESKPDE